MSEQFSNLGSSLLTTGIGDSYTLVTVDDASSFPATNDFRIRINDELMLVTSVASNVFTVERGIEGSGPGSPGTGYSHTTGDTVTHVLTAGAIEALRTELTYNDELAQDAFGAIVADSDSVFLTYDDATPAFTAEVRISSAGSMVIDHVDYGIKLDGDLAAPAANLFYGTSDMPTRGWRSVSIDCLTGALTVLDIDNGSNAVIMGWSELVGSTSGPGLSLSMGTAGVIFEIGNDISEAPYIQIGVSGGMLCFFGGGKIVKQTVTDTVADDGIVGLTISASYDQAEIEAFRNMVELLQDDVRSLRNALLAYSLVDT